MIDSLLSIAATSRATPAPSRCLGARLGFVHSESASILIATIQGLDRFPRLVVVGHFDEAEPSTATRLAIDQHLCRTHLAEPREELSKLFGSHAILQIADVKPLPHHDCPIKASLRLSAVAPNRRKYDVQDN